MLAIDDEIVPVAAVRDAVHARIGAAEERDLRGTTVAVLHVLLRADWLRMTSFERGLGHVLWTEDPEAAVARIEREWPQMTGVNDGLDGALDRGAGTAAPIRAASGDAGSVKMTPTGANAVLAIAAATGWASGGGSGLRASAGARSETLRRYYEERRQSARPVPDEVESEVAAVMDAMGRRDAS